ncbi:TPR [Musa troglodytarum]|uniref:TPR n=1 Tax=Musa troglodytarum TaxID=320322 RepID=A0A9E7FA90_9LILI|nr:TPR [Musa troglodytarum]
MAAQLIHLRFPPRPIHSLSVPLQCVGRDYKVYMRLAARRLTAKWFPKLRYTLEEESVSCDVENSRRSNMLDGTTNSSNGMDDFEGQLKNLFLEVRAKLEMGNKDDAVYLLQANFEAVKEQINAGFKGIEQAAILDTLALGYMGMGDFRTVEHLLNLLKDIVGDLHDDIPLMDSILMHMGRTYSPFLITPLMGMAKALGFTGRVSEAVTLYHRAIDILENARGTENEDLVIPLSALGNLFISEGKATNAEDCFKRILDIYRKIYGEDNGKVGIAMCSLAHALCAKGNIHEAISMYKSGLQVIKDTKYMAVNDDLLEKMRTDLAELLHVAGREQEGRELLEECLLISEKHKGFEHPSSVTHLLNIAMSHSRSKNFAEAERLLRTCLHNMSRTVGQKNQSITVPMLHLAVTLYNLKRDEEAERLALEVVRIREDAFGKESLPVGEALDCLVSIQMRLGKDDNDVLATLKRVLNIQEKEMGFESEETLTTLKKAKSELLK